MESKSAEPGNAAQPSPALSAAASIASLVPRSAMSASPSEAEISARLATALQSRHHGAINSGQGIAMHSPRKQRLITGNKVHSQAQGSAASASATAAAGPSPPVAHALVAVHRANADGSGSRRKGVYHHLPPLTEEQKKILFDALPSLRAMDDAPPASQSLRSTSLAIIKQWLTDKLSTVAWVSLIQKIKLMAEGGEHTQAQAQNALPERGHILAAMGLDARTLHTAGIPPPLVHRIYKALWVYSEGMHELITEVAHHARNHGQVVGNIWKCYAILLEDFQGEEYVMALLQVEAESQRVLKEMEERFSKSLQLKQENEVKTQTEVKTLSALLERSQLEARALLEKKESLLHEIVHLESTTADLESVANQAKKDLWFTSNTLNRTRAKFEALQESSLQMERKFKQDIHELKLEAEEVKASLDQELQTNERLSYKVDRFASNISDLTGSTSRMRAELNEKVQEINLVSKVLEKTSHELAASERDKSNIQALADAKIEAAVRKQLEAEQALARMQEAEAKRKDEEAEERRRAEEVAREQEAAGDPIATSPLVLDLRAQLAFLRGKHDKELSAIHERNALLTERMRGLQKRVRELGGGRRFRKKSDDEEEDDSSGGSSSDDASPAARSSNSGTLIPGGLASVTEKLKGVSTRPAPSPRRTTGDSDDTTSSADHSASSSRRNSKKRTSAARLVALLAAASSGGGSGSIISSSGSSASSTPAANVALLAQEVQALQQDLVSKENINTNLLFNLNKIKVTLSQKEEESKRNADAIVAARAESGSLREALQAEQSARTAQAKKIADQASELDSLRKVERTCADLRASVSDLQKTKISLLSSQTDLSTQLTEQLRESKSLKADAKSHKQNLTRLRDEIRNLQSECDSRAKNQNELGLRIRTLVMENGSLQSLNDEIQRNLKSSADSSSLLGSLETKSNEINRLFLKIRDMEHARIEQLKQHEISLREMKAARDAEADRRVEEALATESARAKKLRAQMAEQKTEHSRTVDALRTEVATKGAEAAAAAQASEKANKEIERLTKQLQQMEADRKREKEQHAADIAVASSPPVAPLPVPSPAQPAVSLSPSPSDPSLLPASPLPRPPNASFLLQSPVPSPAPTPTPSGSPLAPRPFDQTLSLKRSSSEHLATTPISPAPPGSVPPGSGLNSPTPTVSQPALDVEELTQLLHTEGPISAQSLSTAVQVVSQRVAERLAASKEARTQLEEGNFQLTNKVHTLQEQLEVLRAKLRMGEGAGGDASSRTQRRKHKKSVSIGLALLNSDDVEAALSSSDDEGRRGGAVRFSQTSRHISAKRSSGGKPVDLSAAASLRPSPSKARLARGDSMQDDTGSPHKARADHERPPRSQSTAKSPRSTLTRTLAPAASNAGPPLLRRASSMSAASSPAHPPVSLPIELTSIASAPLAEAVSRDEPAASPHVAPTPVEPVATLALSSIESEHTAPPSADKTPTGVAGRIASGSASPSSSRLATPVATPLHWPSPRSSLNMESVLPPTSFTPRAAAAKETGSSGDTAHNTPEAATTGANVRAALSVSEPVSLPPPALAGVPRTAVQTGAAAAPAPAHSARGPPSIASAVSSRGAQTDRDHARPHKPREREGDAHASAASASSAPVASPTETPQPTAVKEHAKPVKRSSILVAAHGPHVAVQSLNSPSGVPVLLPGGAHTVALVGPPSARTARSGSVTLAVATPGTTTGVGGVVTGLLSPAATMAALKQLKAMVAQSKVESHQRAGNFPKL